MSDLIQRLRLGGPLQNEAADRIEQLQARVDELEKKLLADTLRELADMAWISVKSELPERGERCLIFGIRPEQPKGFCSVSLIDSYGVWNGFIYPEEHNQITHWMPLPKPPEDE